MDGDPGRSQEADIEAGAGDSAESFVSLYRRFRPARFGELKGQPHVVRALQSAVRDGHVAHAYLFSGPRGTGKTSAARILAKALNCADARDGEPCGRCASCVEITKGSSLDVHELDAASNNGVDAMRDLVAHAALGTPGRSKVYIVDEVHMLSNAAANALLKTLEEPPAHVVFVLATTDPQKVPATIRSRTQHFEFRLLATATLSELLSEVRDRAGLDLDADAVAVAVRRGRGSARDALSALDQVAASGSIDEVRPEVGSVVDALCDDDAAGALGAVAKLHDAGWGPQQLAADLVEDLREAFLAAVGPAPDPLSVADVERPVELAGRLGLPRLVRSIETLGRAQVDMRDAPDPRVILEVALVRLARPDLDNSTDALLERMARLERLVVGEPGRPHGEPSMPQGPVRGGPSEVLPGPVPEPGPASGRTPTIGALRRNLAPAGPPEGGGGSESGAEPPDGPRAAQQGAEPSLANAVGEDPSRTEGDATPAEPGSPGMSPAGQPVRGAGAPPGSGPQVDRDTLVLAWGDQVVKTLPAKAKALFGGGHFVSVTDGVATFALPSDPLRDRCEELRAVVEDAIATAVGTRLALRLVVEGRPRPAERGGRRARGSSAVGQPRTTRYRWATTGRTRTSIPTTPASRSRSSRWRRPVCWRFSQEPKR